MNMIPEGVGKEMLSHYCCIHCMTFYNNFLSTSASVNNEVNNKCFLGIAYHVSTLLIAEKNQNPRKKEIIQPQHLRPCNFLFTLQLPLFLSYLDVCP